MPPLTGWGAAAGSAVGEGSAVLAHGAPEPQAGPGAWVVPVALLGLALLVVGYGLGVWRLWSRNGRGSGVPVWRAGAFATAVTLLLALESPPVAAAVHDSFSVHMVQHMFLLLVAAPLFAAAGTGLALTMALPRTVRSRLARLRAARPLHWLRSPVPLAATIWLLQGAVLWGWHVSALYEATLTNDLVHLVEHSCFLFASWLLWAPILGTGRHAFSGLLAVVVVFVAGVPATALGALFAFAPIPLYPDSVLAADASDPLRQQQLAGVVMWVPMSVVYLVISAAGFLRWLNGYDRRMPSDRDTPAPPWTGTGTQGVGV